MRKNSATSEPSTRQIPNVPVPNGTQLHSRWDSEGYRDIFGIDRTVIDHVARVYSLASQRSDGAIVLGLVVVAVGEDNGFELNGDQARELAAALLEAAAEVDRWMTR